MQNKIFRSLLFFLIALLSVACGYRFNGGQLAHYQTFHVPYILGDEHGRFTNALIYELSLRSPLSYDSCSPDLLISVCLREPVEKQIGFIYAEEDKDNGEPRFARIVTSNEGRTTIIAEVKVCSASTGEVIRPCQVIAASVEFDFESDFSHREEDIFSIGQLKMHSPARFSSEIGLAPRLAEKIVDSLLYCW